MKQVSLDRTKQLLTWNIAILLGIMVIAAGIIYFVPSKHSRDNLNVQLPQKIQPLPQGRQVYSISTKEEGPKITQAVIDPFDPKIGEQQLFEVSAHYTKPITAMNVVFLTDHGSSTLMLIHASGTTMDGVWRGTTTVIDSHDYIYSALIRAHSGTSTTPIDLSFR